MVLVIMRCYRKVETVRLIGAGNLEELYKNVVRCNCLDTCKLMESQLLIR